MIENVEGINSRRQTHLRKIFITYAFVMTTGLLLSWFLNESYLHLPSEPLSIVAIFGLLFYLSYYVVWFKVQKQYNSDAKIEIMERIISDSNYDLEYQPEPKIKFDEVMSSNLFSKKITYGSSTFNTKFILDDYFYGSVNGLPISFCEVYQYHKKEVERYHSSDGSKYTAEEEVADFHGIFYKIELPESFSHPITLLTKMTHPEDVFHRISIPKVSSFADVSSGITRCEAFYPMGNDELDSYFKVTSSNQETVKEAVTESFSEKLREVRRVIGNEFAITVNKNILYLAKPYKEGFDIIDPNLLIKVKMEQINDTIEMIENSEEICEILTAE